jgi:hypothetical protein
MFGEDSVTTKLSPNELAVRICKTADKINTLYKQFEAYSNDPVKRADLLGKIILQMHRLSIFEVKFSTHYIESVGKNMSGIQSYYFNNPKFYPSLDQFREYNLKIIKTVINSEKRKIEKSKALIRMAKGLKSSSKSIFRHTERTIRKKIIPKIRAQEEKKRFEQIKRKGMPSVEQGKKKIGWFKQRHPDKKAA